MVRFIIRPYNIVISRKAEIYIPIWLDLLSSETTTTEPLGQNLHSNMVRFIMKL